MMTEGKTTPDKATPPLDAREVATTRLDTLDAGSRFEFEGEVFEVGNHARGKSVEVRKITFGSPFWLGGHEEVRPRRALLAQSPADSVARLVEAIRGVDALRNYFMEHLEGCDSPGTRMSLEIHRDIADRAITALDAHRASLDALGAGAGRKRLRVCTHADAHGSCCVPRTGDGFCIWCGSNIPADPDDMRAQRDHNAATAVRTQTEWRKALLAITPAGMTWPDPKPTEIETLKEATAAIGAALGAGRGACVTCAIRAKRMATDSNPDDDVAEARAALRRVETQRDLAIAERDEARELVENVRKALQTTMPGTLISSLPNGVVWLAQDRDAARKERDRLKIAHDAILENRDLTALERDDAPRLLAAAREANRLRAHYAAAGPEHNLLALLDLYHERAEKVRTDAKDTETDRDALAAEVATLRAKIAQHNVWHAENMNDAARLAAELERVKGRLERATNFSWRGGAVWAVMPEDSTLWHVYEERGSCGAALVGKYPTLDAAWSAAEAHAAAQGTDREGAPS